MHTLWMQSFIKTDGGIHVTCRASDVTVIQHLFVFLFMISHGAEPDPSVSISLLQGMYLMTDYEV